MPKPKFVSVELSSAETRLLQYLQNRLAVKSRAAICRMAIIRLADNERRIERAERHLARE